VDTATTLLRLRLNASGAAVAVTGLSVQDTGNAPTSALGLRVLAGATDVTPASADCDPLTRTWALTLTAPVVVAAGGTADLCLRLTAGSAAVGSAVRLVAPVAQIVANGTVTATKPLASTATTVVSGPWLDLVGTYSLAPATVVEDTFASMLKLRLQACAGTVHVRGFQVRDTGSAPADSLALRILRGGRAFAGTTTYDALTRTWTATFTKPLALSDGAYVYYELQVAASPAALGQRVQLAISAADWVQADTPVAGRAPYVSDASVVTTLRRLALGATDLAPAASPVGTAAGLLRLRFAASQGAVNVTSLRLRHDGSAPATALAPRLLLSGQTLAATTTYDAATGAWTLAPTGGLRVPAGEAREMDAQVVPAAAAAGGTARLTVVDATGVQADAPVSASWPLASGATTITLRLSAMLLNMAPATTLPATWTALGKLRLEALDAPVTIQSLTLREDGTVPLAALAVRFLAGGKALDGTLLADEVARTWTFTFARPLVLALGGYVYLELQEQCTTSAWGGTLRLSLAAASAVGTTATPVGSFPLQTGTSLLALLTATATDVAPATVAAGSDTTLLRLKLAAYGRAVTLTGLKVQESGTALAGQVGVRLVRAGRDITPAAASFDSAAKSWLLPLSPAVSLAAGTSTEFELRARCSREAAGRTVRFAVPDAGAVYTSLRASGAFPLVSGAALITAPTLGVSGSSLAPAAALTGVAAPLLRVRLAASGGSATLSGLTLHETGDVPPAGLALALTDRATSGAVPCRTSVDSARRLWFLTFERPLVLGAGTAAEYDVSALASQPGTLRVGLDSASAVAATAPVSGSFPLVSGATSVVTPATLTVTALPANAPTTAPTDAATTLLTLVLSAADGPATITGLTIDCAGTADPERLGLHLADADGASVVLVSQTWDPAARRWALVLGDPLVIAAGASWQGTLRVWPEPDQHGGTAQVTLAGPAALSWDDDLRVAGDFPLASATVTVADAALAALGVEVASTRDGQAVPGLLSLPAGSAPDQFSPPVPLLVLVDTWLRRPSGALALVPAAVERGWAVVVPGYRGAGDPAAVQDVLDAVALARQRARIDAARIYLYGAAGGGAHMALALAASQPTLWAAARVTSPLSELAVWHAENLTHGWGYEAQLETLCGGAPGTPATDAAYAARSPLLAVAAASALPLDIVAGIDDGHSGPVPVSHGLRAYNVVATAAGRADRVVAAADIDCFTTQAAVPPALAGEREDDPELAWAVLWRRAAANVRVTLLAGGHGEPGGALDWLGRQRQGQGANFRVCGGALASSEAPGHGAGYACDGDPTTSWLTPDGAGYPHELRLDLGSEQSIEGFTYLPRGDDPTGTVREYAFYVSTDGVAWGTPVAQGKFTSVAWEAVRQFAYLAQPVTARYIKLVALAEINGGPSASAAEVGIIRAARDIVRVGCFGDCISQATALSNTAQGFPAQLGRLLGERYQVRVFARSGRCILRGGDYPLVNEPVFAEGLAWNPQIVTLQLGTNDARDPNWALKAQIGADNEYLLGLLQALPSRPTVYSCLPPMLLSASPGRIVANELLPIMRAAAANRGVPVIDLHDPLQDSPQFFAPDGVHPLPAGHEALAMLIWRALTGN
jgi:lysophospholipase L1-like esterase